MVFQSQHAGVKRCPTVGAQSGFLIGQPGQVQGEDCVTARRTPFMRFHLKARTNFANGRRFQRDYADKTCPGSGITRARVLGCLNGK